MIALKCLLVAACGTALLAPAASYGAENNAAGYLSYASHYEIVKAAIAESSVIPGLLFHPLLFQKLGPLYSVRQVVRDLVSVNPPLRIP